MANKFLDHAKEVLAKVPSPLTFKEIWEKGVEFGLDKKLQSEGKTPWNTLGAQLFLDVRDNSDSIFLKVGKRPARFFLKNRQSEIDIDDFAKIEVQDEKKQEEVTRDYTERDLHIVLSYYVNRSMTFGRGKAIYTKTICHEKSKKAGYSEWVYPDLVGFYLPMEDWQNDVFEFNKMTERNILKLYSFELKKNINRGNYRESFFQTVSNSSWAHEGYLVCANLKEDEDLLSELERLSKSFGIGIIHLNIDDVHSSEILFQAHSREYLDWDTMNKLCEENSDFKKFMQDVKIDFESKRIHKAEYDNIPIDIESYISKTINKKKQK
jgi:hypothetical protein